MPIDDCIELNPKIILGQPVVRVVRGTRIAVDSILRKIAEGADEAALLAACPALAKADLRAAVTDEADTPAQGKTVVPTA